MKILLSAFACQPGLGSEEGVGWGVARTLAENHRVHVLTTPRCRESIERHLASQPCEQLSFSYHDCAPWIVRAAVTSSLWQVYYHIWQCRIGSWAKAIAAEFEPDVLHHVTYARYWTPCSLYRLGRPLVWGPLGGGDACPREFRSALTGKERLGERVREFAQWIARLDPLLRTTARNATVALASTSATEERLRELGCRHVVHCFQNAIDEELAAGPLTQPDVPLFCSVGRLLGWKGHVLALRALARLQCPAARLVIVGDGPARPRLMALAAKLKISEQVQIVGPVSHEVALTWIKRATALVHSSFHDQAPTVILEAMAMGTPVIGLRLGGVVHQVTYGSGMPVIAYRPQQAEADIALAMRRLVVNPALRAQIAIAGRHRVLQQFTWRSKANEFTRIYHDALKCFDEIRSAAPIGRSTRIAA
jgi:glycosyltransferase involved in cell wall biosynthesis